MIDRLRRVNLFSELGEKQLAALASVAAGTGADKGQEIFQEGEKAVGLFAVDSGRVKIYKLAPNGKEHILHVFGPGEVFAEAAVFAGGRYPASAAALEDTSLVFIDRERFRGLIGRDPDLALSMLALLSRRLMGFAAKLEALSLKEVPERLAAHLLLLRAERGADRFRLDLPKGQLASLLGTIPETISRVLGRLGEAGYVRMSGREIEILDPEGLEALASGLDRLS